MEYIPLEQLESHRKREARKEKLIKFFNETQKGAYVFGKYGGLTMRWIWKALIYAARGIWTGLASIDKNLDKAAKSKAGRQLVKAYVKEKRATIFDSPLHKKMPKNIFRL